MNPPAIAPPAPPAPPDTALLALLAPPFIALFAFPVILLAAPPIAPLNHFVTYVIATRFIAVTAISGIAAASSGCTLLPDANAPSTPPDPTVPPASTPIVPVANSRPTANTPAIKIPPGINIPVALNSFSLTALAYFNGPSSPIQNTISNGYSP